MPKVLFINLGNFGSTGRIVNELSKTAEQNGFDTVRCYPQVGVNAPVKVGDYVVSSNITRIINNGIGYLTGFEGRVAWCSTKKLVRFIESENPDIIHLHNLHSSFINLSILFNYLSRTNKKVVWTLHDCWSFTGRCPHFQLAKCDRWRTGCFSCPYPRFVYPQSLFDRTSQQWKMKKCLFTSLDNLVLITPSKWLADLVSQSYMCKYDVKVIHNGINLSEFKPIRSDFRSRHNIPDNCRILLGVSFGWGNRKGLDVFIELARRLSPDLFRIVLVGTDGKVDGELPRDIISIHRTSNQHELAEIYSVADLFVNPTREEVFGMVNIEALACGTPVITFDVGGSPECIDDKTGFVVGCDDIDLLEKSIIQICNDGRYREEDCIERAKSFSTDVVYQEYIEIYKDCLKERGAIG